MAMRDTYPFLAFGGKIDPVSEIRNAGIVTSGSVFWVKNGSDSDFTTFKDAVGAANLFTGIQAAINACRNDKNDYVLVVPQDTNTAWTADTAGTAILLNKARVHLISVGYTRSVYGYSNTLRGHGTSAAYDTAIIKVLAPGCEIAGFRFLGTAGTTANGTMSDIMLLGTAASGTAHQTWVHDCSIETNLAAGGGAGGTPVGVDMTHTTGPDGARFDNCLIGNTNRGPITGIQLNHIGKHHRFHDCQLIQFVGAAGDSMVKCGTGNTGYTLFRNCDFVNLDSATAETSAFTGSVTTKNPVLLYSCGGVNITAMGTDPTVYVSPNQSGTSGAGVHNPGIFLTGTAGIVAA